MNKRIGSVQIESEVLRKPALHIAKPLTTTMEASQTGFYDRFSGLTVWILGEKNKTHGLQFLGSRLFCFSSQQRNLKKKFVGQFRREFVDFTGQNIDKQE